MPANTDKTGMSKFKTSHIAYHARYIFLSERETLLPLTRNNVINLTSLSHHIRLDNEEGKMTTLIQFSACLHLKF